MLRVSDLRKSFGTRTLFDGVTFAMTPGERLGLVGRNGSGKTTLFRLIMDQEVADAGRIERPRHYTVEHLSQHLEFDRKTVLEEACSNLPVQEGGWVEQHRAEEALMGLGFSVSDFDRPPQEMSGGFQVRLQLARLLVSAPDLLLLDEPSNYLDIVSLRWLQRYLRNWKGELILITHDRNFMDSITTHSMVIHRGKVRRVQGTTPKLYEMLAVEEETYERTRLNEERSRRDDERLIERFRYKASKARQVQSRIKMLAKKGSKEKLEEIANLSFLFNAAPFNAHTMLQAEGLEFSYDTEALIENLTLSIEMGDRIGVIGKNGKGKTTLLNLLAGELKPRSGMLKHHPGLRLAHFGQTNIDRLREGLTVEEEIQSALSDTDRGKARGICGLMMFSGDDATKKVEVLSGGERARVLLGKLLVSPANLLLLDEPTNHLDMESVDSLIEAVGVFPGGALIVTHDERVLHALATRLVIFDRGRTTIFEGSYRDFLDRVGWSDEEEEEEETKTRARGGGNRKEMRRQRAEIVAARSKALRPLQKELTGLENAIIDLEGKLAETERLLAEASQSQDGASIAEHSKNAARIRVQIEDHFDRLATVTDKHDQSARGYEERLEKLDN